MCRRFVIVSCFSLIHLSKSDVYQKRNWVSQLNFIDFEISRERNIENVRNSWSFESIIYGKDIYLILLPRKNEASSLVFIHRKSSRIKVPRTCSRQLQACILKWIVTVLPTERYAIAPLWNEKITKSLQSEVNSGHLFMFKIFLNSKQFANADF